METLTKVAVATIGPCVDFLESLSFIGVNSHIVKLPAVDAMLQPTADSLGMNLCLIKYTLSLFLFYPLSAVLFAIPNKTAKNLFNLVVGVAFVQWIYGPDWIHSFISSAVTYLICALAPKKSQHLIVFLWVMGYMTGSHIYRMYVSYMSGIFDFTGTQMVLTMKLTSFAYNYFDGTADKKKVFPEKPYEDKKVAKLYDDRRRFAVTSLPNPIDFFGYVYCFSCILAGPAFEYRDYEAAMDGSAFKKQVLDKDGKPVEGKFVFAAPSRVFPAITRLLLGVVCLVGYMQVNSRFQVAQHCNPKYLAEHYPVWPRFLFLCIAMFGDRLKYYFAWKIAEGCCVLGGFGFEGFDKEGKAKGWKGVENIDIVGFEFATNLQSVSRSWNKRTQGWLERYTYNRTGRSLVATYVISALWHGLYPGFFMMFLSMPLMTNCERLIRAKINPYFCPGYDGFNAATYPKGFVPTAYWWVCWAGTMTMMNYVVQVFSMGSLENALNALRSYNYAGHILLVAIYVVLEMVPTPKKKDKAVTDKKAN
jgi:hypothetical protein